MIKNSSLLSTYPKSRVFGALSPWRTTSGTFSHASKSSACLMDKNVFLSDPQYPHIAAYQLEGRRLDTYKTSIATIQRTSPEFKHDFRSARADKERLPFYATINATVINTALFMRELLCTERFLSKECFIRSHALQIKFLCLCKLNTSSDFT